MGDMRYRLTMQMQLPLEYGIKWRATHRLGQAREATQDRHSVNAGVGGVLKAQPLHRSSAGAHILNHTPGKRPVSCCDVLSAPARTI